MIRFFLHIGLATLFATLQSCNNGQKTTSQPSDSATTGQTQPNPAVDYAAEPITGRLASLGLTRDSHWRGISLGDDLAAVKTIEKGEAFENDARHVGYTVEFPSLESMDVLYYQQNGKVSTITVDLFLNNRVSVDGYSKELTTYFTTRYGAAKLRNGSTNWNGPTGEQITLRDVSKGKDFGLKIAIAPVGQTTASAK
ncbi:hypothetical protein GGR92_003259 [Spirosoma lacussanchae]|uniref:hypothetical protein n=1 Tax=Spirosoma lacussanchae TaxID=1884249 RepID=UPI001108DB7A|nr:hypothetical protein [Spirosoma lacussanchae]